ncbi:MAG TPA: hypothetical protein VM243_12485 [Phycisphaerae bacterium]|nr:hypothetical protein [Phycisphaerae bacterium]
MLWRRRILLLVTILGVGGSLSATLGYGLYLRSDRYRVALQRDLTERLSLRVGVGRVRALDTTSRAFHDIRVTMLTREDEVFRCAKAVWHDESSDGRPRFTLDLVDGWLLVGTHQWSQADYESMLRSGLGQDFAALHLRQVHLDRVDLEWWHPDLTLKTSDAVGEIVYDDQGNGRASLIAYDLNGQPVKEPIRIIARFTPGAGLRFHEVQLEVPAIPLSRLGLDELLRGEVSHGVFEGRLGYRESNGHEYVELSGALEDARLEELTEPVIGGPFRGGVDVVIDKAVFVDRRLDVLRFSGRLSDLSLAELVPFLRSSTLRSQVQLRVHQGVLRGSTVEYLSTTGQATDLSLEAISALIGRGTITGRLQVEIHDLRVVDDQLQRAEVDLIAVPPDDDAGGTIDRSLLEWASQELLGFDVARILPERIEYARLGVKLVIEGETLRVYGTHGRSGRTILTVRVLGREVPLVGQFDRTFEVGPLVSMIRERIESYELERLRQWWETIHAPPEEMR